ncbi:hypothetical protein Ocin01_14380 [Orchesella cincta]|uniref:Uncharacterized protein n=1 Tax=Orchesella cincta TaxID=48709 RepID=A0A1D2MHA6_ORCCI|nr:hypothetical protein Ocin01_14380 [Orchesella cincta]
MVSETQNGNTPMVLEIENVSRSNNSTLIEEKEKGIVSNSSSNLLNIYFNCCYYMLLFPFRPEYDKSTGRCSLHVSFIQEKLCYYFMWPFIITNFLTKFLRIAIVACMKEALTIRNYCQTFASLLYSYKQLMFLWTAFKHQAQIRNYLSSVSCNSVLQKRRETEGLLGKINHHLGWKLVFFLFIFLVYFINYFQIGKVIVSDYPSFLAKSRLYVIFTSIRNGTRITKLEQIAGGGLEIIFCVVALLNHFLVTIFFILPIPLWNSIRRLERLVVDAQGEVDFHALLEKYEEVKLLSRCGNAVWGSLSLIWILDYSTTLVLNFDEFIHSKSFIDVVLLFGSQALLITALILGSQSINNPRDLRS